MTERSGLSFNRDEMKALLALGVISGFAVVFELSNLGVFLAIFGPAPSYFADAELVTLGVDAFFFGLYVALITVALAFDSFRVTKSSSRKLESAGNAFFLVGALGMFAVGAVFVLRITTALIH